MLTSLKNSFIQRTLIFFAFLLLCFSNIVFGQDPWVGIDFNITNDNVELVPQLRNEFKITHRNSNEANNQWIKYYRRPETNYNEKYRKYEYIDPYAQYCGEIHELTIIYKTDTMNIRLKWKFSDSIYHGGIYKDMLSNDGCWLGGPFVFSLDIPFQKGYFEITEFNPKSGKPKDGFKWTPLQKQDRKLFVSGN